MPHPPPPATGGPILIGGPFCLHITYQAYVETPLLEFHLPNYLRPDLLGPADAQRLFENDVGKDEGSLGVPTPTNNTP